MLSKIPPRALSLLLLVSSVAVSLAANFAANRAAAQQGSDRTVRAQPPEPTFRVTPLVHSSEVLPGQETSFEFKIEAVRESLELSVQSVGLRQQPNGQILADEQAQPPGHIRFLSPQKLRINKGEAATVRGAWQTPSQAGQFCAAGLLLTDLTNTTPLDAAAAGGGKTRGAQIRFVTRYLLRLEATTRGRLAANQLPTIQHAELREVQGLAVVQATLDGRQCGSLRTQAMARLLDDAGEPLADWFPLGIPVRAGLATAKRWEIPLLEGTQVQIVGQVPEPLFAGDYTLELAVAPTARPQATARFPLTVTDQQFPAQQSVVARVVKHVTVEPRQIELSLARGGNRIVPLKFENSGQREVTIELATSSSPWLLVRPQKFTLRPRAQRNVMVAVKGGARSERPRYTYVTASIAPTAATAGGSIELPVALLGESSTDSAEPSSQLAFDEARIEQQAGGTVIVVGATNRGEQHVAPAAKLRIANPLGQSVEIDAGFGRWILPGEQTELRFPVKSLPAGRYDLDLIVADQRTTSEFTHHLKIEAPQAR